MSVAWSGTFTGGRSVAEQALVNGTAGLVVRHEAGVPIAVLAFTAAGGRVAELDIHADPTRLGPISISDVVDG